MGGQEQPLLLAISGSSDSSSSNAKEWSVVDLLPCKGLLKTLLINTTLERPQHTAAVPSEAVHGDYCDK